MHNIDVSKVLDGLRMPDNKNRHVPNAQRNKVQGAAGCHNPSTPPQQAGGGDDVIDAHMSADAHAAGDQTPEALGERQELAVTTTTTTTTTTAAAAAAAATSTHKAPPKFDPDMQAEMEELVKLVNRCYRRTEGRVGILYHAGPPELPPLQAAVYDLAATLQQGGLLNSDLRDIRDDSNEDFTYVGEHTDKVWRARASYHHDLPSEDTE